MADRPRRHLTLVRSASAKPGIETKVLVGLTGVGVLMCVAGGAVRATIDPTVVVEISGPGTAHVTWWRGGRPLGVEDPATLPWERRFGADVQVEAQLKGEGQIVCSADGKRRTVEGRFPYVVCP